MKNPVKSPRLRPETPVPHPRAAGAACLVDRKLARTEGMEGQFGKEPPTVR